MTEEGARELVPAGRHPLRCRDTTGFSPRPGIGYSGAQPLTRRYLTELPQGRKAARVGWLWRVRGGRFAFPGWRAEPVVSGRH
ncbi:hypothetical protein GCM10010521_34270 [Streptomyces rameus]|uniref:Uncharacterized protein n=1 Tax=Streptomyces rameus TaxID=68261 RepID=A0ABP6NDS3_9ACTN